jgi:hypothetical protein
MNISRRMTNPTPATDGEVLRTATMRVRRSLYAQTGVPFPVDAGVADGDDVEFASPRHPDVLRRGRVLGVFGSTFLVAEHRAPGNCGRQNVYRPVVTDLRRVYRDGVEVARLPWLGNDGAVPLPGEEDVDMPLARAPLAVARVSTAVFLYRPGDEVAYDGKGGGVYRAVVSLVIPAHGSYEQEVHVRNNGYVSAPRLAKIRRAWRDGVLVAVRPDVLE